jgi:hypothetical protein
MNKSWKSIIIIFACVAMIFSSVDKVHAQTVPLTYTYDGKVYNITQSTDKNNVTTVNVTSVDGTSTVVLDKKTNVAIIKEVNAVGKVILDKTVTVAATASTVSTTGAGVNVTPLTIIASGSEGWWGHSYYVSTFRPFNWHECISSSTCKYVDENSGNTTDLTGFKDAVDDASVNEAITYTMLAAGVIAAVVGAITAAGTASLSMIIGFLVALGAGVGAAAYFFAAEMACKDADFHYARV